MFIQVISHSRIIGLLAVNHDNNIELILGCLFLIFVKKRIQKTKELSKLFKIAIKKRIVIKRQYNLRLYCLFITILFLIAILKSLLSSFVFWIRFLTNIKNKQPNMSSILLS